MKMVTITKDCLNDIHTCVPPREMHVYIGKRKGGQRITFSEDNSTWI